jgi:hypothetical protein
VTTSAEIANRLGASDLFVLARVERKRLLNLDGFGRGAGWAGNVNIDQDEEPFLAAADADGLARAQHALPARVFGPYWASEAVAVRAGPHLVVFGGTGVTAHADPELIQAAGDAAALIGETPPSKALADDLEVAQAARDVAETAGGSLEEVAESIATSAAQALSCEFGAVLLYGPPLRVFLSREGWRPPATEQEMIAAMLPLRHAAEESMLVEQDASGSPFPYRPLSFADGLVARLAVSLGTPDRPIGLLVVAHASTSPRGFTGLCQRVAATIAEGAGPIIDGATRP